MATHELKCEYHEARLRLAFDNIGKVTLYINNLPRQSQTLPDQATGVVRLSSPVQTGYEYHEEIEGIVTYTTDKIDAVIIASTRELAQYRVTLGGD